MSQQATFTGLEVSLQVKICRTWSHEYMLQEQALEFWPRFGVIQIICELVQLSNMSSSTGPVCHAKAGIPIPPHPRS